MYDHTYLSQLPVRDLLDRARAHGDDGLIRALLERLEDHLDAYDQIERLQAELEEAEARADSWREDAQAIQRQLDEVRP